MNISAEELIHNLEILFEYDNYEEVVYPIIRTYFLYSLQKLENPDEYDLREIEKALEIIRTGS